MLKHADIWKAIDLLATSQRLSASGLAKHAGLDPTTFNKSKRLGERGKKRWPSTESLAKVLAATKTSLSSFVHMVESKDEPANRNRPAAKKADTKKAVAKKPAAKKAVAKKPAAKSKKGASKRR